MKEPVRIEGFARVTITEDKDGKEVIVGDSGWMGPNQITNLGFSAFFCDALGASAASSQVGYCALGTGSVPGAAATTLPGEISGSTQRRAVTYANVSSTTARFTVTFDSGTPFLSGASNISNVGLFAVTNTDATLFAGITYASSSCDTNQNVNVQYEIRLSSS